MQGEERCNDIIKPQVSSNAANTRKTFCLCSGRVLCFLISLFTFTLGLILGVIFFVDISTSLPAVIVLAVVLLILIISLLIFRCCFNCHKILS